MSNCSPEPAEDITGFRTAPTDEQLRKSILFTVGFDADVHLLDPSEWERFSDRHTDPVPAAFNDAILKTLGELNLYPKATSELRVEVEDRPPRADPLFARYFVDLTALAIQIANDFGIEIASGIITSLVLGAGSKMKSLVSSRKDGRFRIRESFNAATLELLCHNFVRIQRPEMHIVSVSRRTFNTRYQTGYIFPVDPELPMGWVITVDLGQEQFEFTVDGNANIHKLEIVRKNERSTMENASLKTPELATKTRQRIAPWIGVADADSL